MKLTACVIACDEEDHLPRCLDSVAWADEVVVIVDAKSRDRSEAIAGERGARVEVHPYAGDIEQKRACVALARNDWVLIIDPDEELQADASRELRVLLDGAPEDLSGVEINRITYHLGRWIRHGDFHPDWKLRAFRRSRASWHGLDPHGRVMVKGRVVRLRGKLLHRSYRDLAEQIDRIQFFSGQAAQALRQSGRGARLRDLVLRPPARFVRAYLLKRGFLDGVPGFAIAAATAFHVFLKYAKLWELGRIAEKGEAPLP